MFDVATDMDHVLLKEIVSANPHLVEFVKHASVTVDGLADHAFADPHNRRFPIHTPDDAILSLAYAVKQASVSDVTRRRIANALALYGVDVPRLETKTASTEPEVEVHYLLPHENQIPVSTQEDVKLASKALFDPKIQRDVSRVTEAAVNAIKVAADMGMAQGDLPGDLYKLAGMTTCDAGILLDWIEARAFASRADEACSDTYTKIANVVLEKFPHTGMITNRQALIKIADAIAQADEIAGLTPLYGNRLVPPIETVFNMSKLAAEAPGGCELAGNAIDLSKLKALPAESIEEFFGEGASFDGMDDESIKSMVETLPADIQRHMYTNLKSYLT